MGMEQEKAVAQAAKSIVANPSVEPLFVISEAKTPVLALAITTVMAKAKELKNDKGNYTVEYFCAELFSDKLKSFNDYLDANEERKNKELFQKAMNALPTPNPTVPEELVKYFNSLNALKTKYRIGETKKSL
jgi:type III secretory pathway component EscR